AGNGNFVLTSFVVMTAKSRAGPDAPTDTVIPLRDASATFAQQVENRPNIHAASATLNPNKKEYPGWAILPRAGQANSAVFQTAEDIGDGTERPLLFMIGHAFGDSHALGRFRISATNSPRPVVADPASALPPEIATVLAIDPEKRTPEQKSALAKHYRSISPLLE